MLDLLYLLTLVRVHLAELLRRGGGAGGYPDMAVLRRETGVPSNNHKRQGFP
jgi:hypothetical protein